MLKTTLLISLMGISSIASAATPAKAAPVAVATAKPMCQIACVPNMLGEYVCNGPTANIVYCDDGKSCNAPAYKHGTADQCQNTGKRHGFAAASMNAQ